MFGTLDNVLAPSPSLPVQQSITPERVVLDGVSVNLAGSPVVHNASLDVDPGQVLALLGPSGCGKTTLLRAIAGLQSPSSGTITIGTQVVSDGKTFVAPERRRVGMVFQDGGLFPHLTVEQNVHFGLRHHPDPDRRVAEMLELVSMSEFSRRLPGTLSGGQRQRIAVARALAPEPSVLLLDEPFSALDAGLRVQIRREVKRLIAAFGITTIVVTHDQEEAFAMGEQIAVMSNGAIEQVGTPSSLYEAPATPWVAQFVGDGVRIDGTHAVGFVTTPFGRLPAHPAVDGPLADGNVTAIVRPEQLTLHHGTSGDVVDVEYYGHDVRYDVMLDTGLAVTVRALRPQFTTGDRVDVAFSGTSVPVWPNP
jgi:iron(III) transport system ATP-binding protein